MNVMYTCDNNYVWLMGISVISLFENNKDMDELKVYLLGENISSENKEKLKIIGAEYSRDVEIIEVPKLDIPPSLISARWPLAAYTRLFSGKILPKSLDKILYLDCDTIILGNISELNRVQFNENIAMGVKDCIGGVYKQNIGLHKNDAYFNAGVILFNMNALRKVDVSTKIETYMDKYMKLINYADQDIFNGMFRDEIGELNPRFNLMTIDVVYSYEEILKLRVPTNFYAKEAIQIAKKNPMIIHYTTNMLTVRPWFSNTNHPLAHEFKKYMAMSPWKNRELSTMVFTSKESKLIRIVQKLPSKIACDVLGMIHAVIRPMYVRMKSKE